MTQQTILLMHADGLLGSTLATYLYEHGRKVIVHAHKDATALEQITEELLGSSHIVCDSSSYDALSQQANKLRTSVGPIHSCIHLPPPIKPYYHPDPQKRDMALIHQQRQSHVSSYLNMLRIFLPSMSVDGGGSVVNLLYTYSDHIAFTTHNANNASMLSINKTFAQQYHTDRVLLHTLRTPPTNRTDIAESYHPNDTSHQPTPADIAATAGRLIHKKNNHIAPSTIDMYK